VRTTTIIGDDHEVNLKEIYRLQDDDDDDDGQLMVE
jgi:hypothetical protein